MGVSVENGVEVENIVKVGIGFWWEMEVGIGID